MSLEVRGSCMQRLQPMITDRIKQLAALQAKAAALEAEINSERSAALAALPAQFGFESVDDFAAAVRAAAGKRRGRKPKSVARATPPKAKAMKTRRKRAVITDSTRAQVKQLVGEGKTGAKIATALGISLPSVQNIKKALGLVQKKKG